MGHQFPLMLPFFFFLGTAITCIVDKQENILHPDVPYCAKDVATQWEAEMQNWLN